MILNSPVGGCDEACPDPSYVDVLFVAPDGERRQMPWLRAVHEQRLKDCVPVRMFPVRRGKRLAPGWWWSSTTERLLHYGSAAQRDRLMLLDQERRVVDVACRPVEFVWRAGSSVVRHAPHFLVRWAGGRRELVDCVGVGGSSRQLASKAKVLRVCARAAGWGYRLVGPADPVRVANVRWLSGYRHPCYADAAVVGRLREACVVPRPMAEVVGEVGEAIQVWPALFHALWSSRLHVDLDQVLGEHSLITDGSGAA
ncbi:TnsA-like heteromeric transposase endonuclease subunit [Streptomyces sp. NPDC006393]|uniref:TnsA-like heteromeric transposase endonuclease subunit n=1 Tax=Streptomyces sp. NPDC006393 TaxID=3156763 RepID=UPI0033CC4E7C